MTDKNGGTLSGAAIDAAADVFERLVGIRDMCAVEAILKAAAPHLMAEALNKAADAMTREEPGAGPWGTPQHEHQSGWLRARAETLRHAD